MTNILRRVVREALEDEEIPGFGRDYSEKPKEKMTNAKYINFANRNQVILYECELKGQISDGQWENSYPHDHFESMCDAIAKVGSPLGPSFYPRRRYNFASPSLLSVVGERMIYYVKLYNAFPSLSFDDNWNYELSAFFNSDGVFRLTTKMPGASSYVIEKIEKILNKVGVTEQEFCDKINSISYNMKNLKNDLRDMSKIVNSKLDSY
jgi:hypothetical protein